MTPEQWLQLRRVVRFGETDAAGVIHFHQLLRWCHEAWEESLMLYGVTADEIFPGGRDRADTPLVALPIVHCEADFRRPIYRGDQLILKLQPERLDPGSFQITTTFHRDTERDSERDSEEVARGLVRHLAINVDHRQRCALQQGIDRWLEASSLGVIAST
ncbi:MAG: acyl-CoA thioesterase [Prochlorococcus sp.]|nr:acyl-CoA thioesterase [Prochlorococcaceae cyanobacterium Fu_MAG_50]